MDLSRIFGNAQSMLSNAQSSVHDSYDDATARLLDRMGLQHKRSTGDVVLPALGIFTAGVAAGAVLGLLFAPRRGDETRTEIVHRLEDLRERVRRTEEAQAEAEAKSLREAK